MTMENGDEGVLELDRRTRSLGVPIDHQHLADFAMGDPMLERRFLCLFLEHAPIDMKRMPGATLGELQRAVHSLRSSASSIGAWRVVEHADKILEIDEGPGQVFMDELLDDLHHSVERTLAYIGQFVGHD